MSEPMTWSPNWVHNRKIDWAKFKLLGLILVKYRSLAVRVYFSKFSLKDLPLILVFWPNWDGLVQAWIIKKSMSEPITWALNWVHASKIDPVQTKFKLLGLFLRLLNSIRSLAVRVYSSKFPLRDSPLILNFDQLKTVCYRLELLKSQCHSLSLGHQIQCTLAKLILF